MDSWYAVHGSVTGALALGALATQFLWPKPGGALIQGAPRFERFAENYFSPVSDRASDLSLWVSVLAPLGTLAIGSSGRTWGNASLIYGEAMSASVALNLIVKRSAPRARPYVQSDSAEVASYRQSKGDDELSSFYSGHTSQSFTSAAAGSYLFSATHESQTAGALHWGFSMAFAGFTGHARVRAGVHYPTDVLTGALVGVGFGLGVPLLHRVYVGLDPMEVVAAGGGALGGAMIALLLPKRISRQVAALDLSLTPLRGGATVMVSGVLP